MYLVLLEVSAHLYLVILEVSAHLYLIILEVIAHLYLVILEVSAHLYLVIWRSVRTRTKSLYFILEMKMLMKLMKANSTKARNTMTKQMTTKMSSAAPVNN